MTEHDLVTRTRGLFASAVGFSLPECFEPPRNPLYLDLAGPGRRGEGLELLSGGQVAVLTLAGGRSTRSGGRFRGDLPIGPVTGRTLMDLHGERLAAIRARYAPGLQWLLLVSDATLAPVQAALDRRHRFGFAREDVRLLVQPSLPVLDEHLDPVRAEDGGLISAPTGHGGILTALGGSDVLDQLASRGIEYLFMFQYPNALEHICDPVMVAHHAESGSDATLKGILETRPDERVGRMIQLGGTVAVVEYYVSSSPQTEPLATMPMYSGTAVWSVGFLRDMLARNIRLPFYRVPHREPGSTTGLWKVEQFSFDLLRHASTTATVLGRRREEYSAIKTETGPDSAQAARRALADRYGCWLTAAGATGPVGALIEISPAYALSGEELLSRLPPGFRFGDVLNLDSEVDGA